MAGLPGIARADRMPSQRLWPLGRHLVLGFYDLPSAPDQQQGHHQGKGYDAAGMEAKGAGAAEKQDIVGAGGEGGGAGGDRQLHKNRCAHRGVLSLSGGAGQTCTPDLQSSINCLATRALRPPMRMAKASLRTASRCSSRSTPYCLANSRTM